MKQFFCYFVIIALTPVYNQVVTVDANQFSRPRSVNTIIKDLTNPGIIHVGTDIGYIQTNSETVQVRGFQNLTSQEQPVGNVRGIAQNHSTGNLIYAFNYGFGVKNGDEVDIFTNDNSDLAVGQNVEGFGSFQVQSGIGENLWVYHLDDTIIQEYNNGSFGEPLSIGFKPNTMLESLDGLSLFIGTGNGLLKMEKETGDTILYTTENSDLVSNVVESLFQNEDGKVLIGTFQGLNTLTPGGEWGTAQAQVPDSPFYFPVYSIEQMFDDKYLINSSKPNSASSFGFNIVDVENNIWTTLTDIGSSCINSSVFNSITSDGSGNIIFSPFDVFDNSKLIKYDPVNDICEPFDINYSGAPIINDFILNFGIRLKPDNRLEVGLADFDKVIMFEYDYSEAEEPFGVPMMLSTGEETVYEVFGAANNFIGDALDGLLFIKEDNSISKVNIGIDGFSSLKTKIPKKVGEGGVISPMVLGVENGESKLYYADCDLFSVNCTDWFDYSIEDLDPLEPISFGVIKDESGDNLVATRHKKTTASNEEAAIELSKYNLGTVNGIAEAIDFISAGAAMSSSDPYIESLRLRFGASENSNEDLNPSPFVLFWQSEETFTAYVPPVEDSQDLSPITRSIDLNEDDIPDQILGINNTVLSLGDNNLDLVFNYFLVSTVTELMAVRLKFFRNEGESEVQFESEVIGEKILNNPPGDLVVYSSELVQTDEDSATIILYTNYGFLFKSDVDLNNISLSINEHSDLNFSNLYPNPAHDIVKITNLEVSSVQVFDLTGQLVLTSKQPSISIRNLPEGLYFIKITEITNGNSIVKKLIKSN